MKKKGCVYFFRHVGLSPVKIGFSTNESPLSRFEQFQTYAPYGTELIGFFITEEAKQIETKLHQKYAAKRLKGEWFEISIEDVNYEINFYRVIEEVNQRQKFELSFAKNVDEKEMIFETNLFRFVKDDEFCNEKILNQKEITKLIGKENCKKFVESKKTNYKSYRYEGKVRKGYKLFFK